jgi:hypothetical protein
MPGLAFDGSSVQQFGAGQRYWQNMFDVVALALTLAETEMKR